MSLSEQDKNKILSLHNNERRAANPSAPALKWDPQLAASAQAWAESGGSGSNHDPRIQGRLGENMASGYPFNATKFEEGVKLWLNEKKDYHGERTGEERPGRTVGHYTQMIWKMTEKVGCGFAKNGNEWVLCCRYEAPGNMMGQTPFDTYGAGGGNDDGQSYDDGQAGYDDGGSSDDGESYEESESYDDSPSYGNNQTYRTTTYSYSYTYETDR